MKTNSNFKKIAFAALFSVLLAALMAFQTQNETNAKTKYAFVTDTEHDKAYDEETKNGYVTLTTNIVSVTCDITDNNIKHQYIDHYNAEEATQNRSRAHIGASGITSVWIYNTYDEAIASRRSYLAKSSSKHKRRIEYFDVTCN